MYQKHSKFFTVKKITKILFTGLPFEITTSVKLSLATLLFSIYIIARVYYGYEVYYTFDELQLCILHLLDLEEKIINFTLISELFVCYLEAKPHNLSSSLIFKLNNVAKKLPLWILYAYVLVAVVLLLSFHIGDLTEIGKAFGTEMGLHFCVHFLSKDRKRGFFRCRRWLVKIRKSIKFSWLWKI